jgi:hypothetical protein
MKSKVLLDVSIAFTGIAIIIVLAGLLSPLFFKTSPNSPIFIGLVMFLVAVCFILAMIQTLPDVVNRWKRKNGAFQPDSIEALIERELQKPQQSNEYEPPYQPGLAATLAKLDFDLSTFVESIRSSQEEHQKRLEAALHDLLHSQQRIADLSDARRQDQDNADFLEQLQQLNTRQKELVSAVQSFVDSQQQFLQHLERDNETRRDNLPVKVSIEIQGKPVTVESFDAESIESVVSRLLSQQFEENTSYSVEGKRQQSVAREGKGTYSKGETSTQTQQSQQQVNQ